MKNILIGFVVTVSLGVHAENLQCENSYKIFEGIYKSWLSVRDGPNLNISLLKQFDEKYDYSRLFSEKHPGQIYYLSNWISVKQYYDQVLLSHAMSVGSRSKNLGIKLEKPKANFFSSVGEVCVIPIESRSLYLDKEVTVKADNIFVRDIKSNEWRVFVYSGIEYKKDFDEFFPNFPKSVKLSEISSSLDPSFEASVQRTAEIYKAYGVDLTLEMIEQKKEARKRIDERRKANGFE